MNSAIIDPVMARAVHPVYGGNYRVMGTLKRLGTPTTGRVYLIRRDLLVAIDSVVSIDGTYEFSNIGNWLGGYMVLARDEASSPVNAAISDYVTLEPMP